MFKSLVLVIGIVALVGCSESKNSPNPELPIEFRGQWFSQCTPTVMGSFDREYNIQSDHVSVKTTRYKSHLCKGTVLSQDEAKQVFTSIDVENPKKVIATWSEQEKVYSGPMTVEGQILTYQVTQENNAAVSAAPVEIYRNLKVAQAAQKASHANGFPEKYLGDWINCFENKGYYLVITRNYIFNFITEHSDDRCRDKPTSHRAEKVMSLNHLVADDRSFQGVLIDEKKPAFGNFVSGWIVDQESGNQVLKLAVIGEKAGKPLEFRKVKEGELENKFGIADGAYFDASEFVMSFFN